MLLWRPTCTGQLVKCVLVRSVLTAPQGACEGWAAARDWVLPDGGVDLDFLEQRFRGALVTATDSARWGVLDPGCCMPRQLWACTLFASRL